MKEPYDLVPFSVNCGNNLGYFGPHEVVLRSRPLGNIEHWGGCKAGIDAIGIESDGTIKACAWTAHCTLGRRGNNPFCYHRVVELKKRGIRERLLPVERAANQPYDFGRFEIVEENWPNESTPSTAN